MQQTVSNQQQQQRSLFAQQQQRQQKPNYKYANNSNSTNNSSTNPNHNPNQTLAPVHGAASSANTTNSTPPPTLSTGHSSSQSSSSAAGNAGSGNRLLSYTTFENNQYKFSLNNALAKGSAGAGVASGGGGSSSNLTGGGGNGGAGAGAGAFSRQRSFVEWPNNPAAPYYYQGPSTSAAQVKRRDAKSDIGVPTRRLSGQSVTKTQLLTGGSSQLANASCYPMHYASSSVTNASFSRALGQRGVGAPHCNGNIGYNGSGSGGFAGLQPAKSDLFLSYIHGGEYERPYIYNYKMPQMPPGLAAGGGKSSGSGSVSCAGSGSGSPKQQQQQQQASAYHISGAQTADPPPPPPPLYGGSAPANDVMYYQFDKGAAVMPTQQQQQPPIVQQPKSAAVAVASAGGGAGAGAASGPLVYLQHGQNVAPSNVTSTQQTVSKPGLVPRQHVA